MDSEWMAGKKADGQMAIRMNILSGDQCGGLDSCLKILGRGGAPGWLSQKSM